MARKRGRIVTREIFDAVKKAYSMGMSREELATAFDLSISTIDSIKRFNTFEEYEAKKRDNLKKYHAYIERKQSQKQYSLEQAEMSRKISIECQIEQINLLAIIYNLAKELGMGVTIGGEDAK